MQTSSPYSIRAICQTDEKTWTKLWLQYMDFYETNIASEITQNTFKKLLVNDDKMGCLLACDENNIPIGFLTYVTHRSTWKLNPVCYLNDLFVCNNHRKNGVASQLLNQLKKLSDQFGWSQIYWLTKPDNFIAQKFYEKIATGQPWIEYVMI